MLWFDITPMRPHEFETVDLAEWTECELLQDAKLQGIADAKPSMQR